MITEKNSDKFKINNIYAGNCIDLMQYIPSQTCDLIVTDPPFAIDFKKQKLNYNRKESNVLEGYIEIPKKDYGNFTISWIKQAYRILKNTGSMYVFSGWNNLKDILNAIDLVGFHTINHIIWKYQFGVYTKRRYVTSHYHILFVAVHPKLYKFNKIEKYPEDVWVINREYWSGKFKTPTKLPMQLVKKIILFSSNKGDLIVDPFIGSGTVAVAAKMLNRNFLGFEIAEKYLEFARERINQTNIELSLFPPNISI